MSNTSNKSVRNKFLLSLGFVHPSAASPLPRSTLPQSCLGNVQIRIEALKSDADGMDLSTHSDESSTSSTSSTSTETIASSPPPSSSPHSNCYSTSPPITIPLRTHPSSTLKRSHSGIVKKNGKGNAGVKFNEDVKVLLIPLRHEYSDRIRSLMYSNAEELYRNASRNTKEFMSEGWSVDDVIEEERMITWGGELIHPVHLVPVQR